MRKEHPAFRMTTEKQIVENIFFMTELPPGLIVYYIKGDKVGDKWKEIYVAFNGSGKEISIAAPSGNYKVFVSGNMLSETIGGNEGYWRLDPYSCAILYQQ